MDADGQWVYDGDALRRMAVNFYENLFKEEGQGLRGQGVGCKFNVIPKEFFDILSMEVTKEEVQQALFEMSPYKAPGPDGF